MSPLIALCLLLLGGVPYSFAQQIFDVDCSFNNSGVIGIHPNFTTSIVDVNAMNDAVTNNGWENPILENWNISSGPNGACSCFPDHWQGVVCTGNASDPFMENNTHYVTEIHVGYLDLSGLPLPPEFADLERLNTIEARYAQLDTTLPAAWWNATYLEHIDLSLNSITGGLPPEWGAMPLIQTITLPINDLSGSLPVEWSNMTNLRTLELNANFLDGSIPVEYWNLPNLTTVDLQANMLTGSLDGEIGDAPSLYELRLGGNDLSGPIPPNIFNSRTLHTLDLANNRLNGSLPQTICNFETLGWNVSLSFLFVQKNNLTGPLPSCLNGTSRPLWLDDFNACENDFDEPLPEWCQLPPLGDGTCDDNCDAVIFIPVVPPTSSNQTMEDSSATHLWSIWLSMSLWLQSAPTTTNWW